MLLLGCLGAGWVLGRRLWLLLLLGRAQRRRGLVLLGQALLLGGRLVVGRTLPVQRARHVAVRHV